MSLRPGPAFGIMYLDWCLVCQVLHELDVPAHVGRVAWAGRAANGRADTKAERQHMETLRRRLAAHVNSAAWRDG